jgi:hypothetical protein
MAVVLRRTLLATLVTAIPVALILATVLLEDDSRSEWSTIDYFVLPPLLLFEPQLASFAGVRMTLGLQGGWLGYLVFWLACLPASLIYVLLAERGWRWLQRKAESN